jgi:hypothetical protein
MGSFDFRGEDFVITDDDFLVGDGSVRDFVISDDEI